ncbi:MAG: sensor histidine kinase, partial [Thermodesulfovibrio sp.]
DEMGQSLTALKLSLSWIRKRIEDEFLQEKFDETLSIVNALIKQVQNISNRLRPSLIDHLTLEDAIMWQVKEFERNTSIPCSVEISEDSVKLARNISLNIFRIFQEALTNVARHANATLVNIKMFRSNGSVLLIIKDNGMGIPEEKIKSPESFGLMAMRERAYSINATFDIRRIPEGGTEVILSVPLRENE